MRELQKVEELDALTKYKKHIKVNDSTKGKIKSFIKIVYELLKTGIIFCLFVQLLRKPEIISMILMPTIVIASTVLKIIGIILLIIIVISIFTT